MRYIHHEGTVRWIFFLSVGNFKPAAATHSHHSLHPIDLCSHTVNEKEELLWLKDSWALSTRWSQHRGACAERACLIRSQSSKLFWCTCVCFFGGEGEFFGFVFISVFLTLMQFIESLPPKTSFSRWELSLSCSIGLYLNKSRLVKLKSNCKYHLFKKKQYTDSLN